MNLTKSERGAIHLFGLLLILIGIGAYYYVNFLQQSHTDSVQDLADISQRVKTLEHRVHILEDTVMRH